MSAPYRDPEHPPACERCAARDKRAADVRRVARNVTEYGVGVITRLLMLLHSAFAYCAIEMLGVRFRVLVAFSLAVSFPAWAAFPGVPSWEERWPGHSRRLALAAWAIVVSLAWAVFVARAP